MKKLRYGIIPYLLTYYILGWPKSPIRKFIRIFLYRKRVGHDWATSLSLFTFMHWRRKWQPTPVFLPGESQGRQSGGLPSMGSHRVGHDWSDLAAAAAAAAQSCLTLCNPMDCGPPGSSVHGDSPGKNTGVGCHTLLWISKSCKKL